MHTRGGRRIALGEDGVGRLGAEPVVEAAPVLASSLSGGNGVYAYGSASSFPTGSYMASNYWVDVLLST